MNNALINALSKQLVETSVGWVPPQVMESRDDSKRLIRRQEIIAPGRFTLLIRHLGVDTQHLCGYVHVTRSLALKIATQLPIDYMGHGTKHIAWKWFNAQRKLVSVGKVSHGDDEDWWVGTAFLHVESESDCIELLSSLETSVDSVRGILD